MYIITSRGCIFNTNRIQKIQLDDNAVCAVNGDSATTISRNPDSIKTIIAGIKGKEPFVEVE